MNTLNFFDEKEEQISIIGGADGPTAIFVSSGNGLVLLIFILAIAIIASLTFRKIKNNKQKY